MLKDIVVERIMNAQSVGTSAVNSSVVDMDGFDGVVFVAAFGTITDGTPGIKAQQGEKADGSDMADLEGTKVSLSVDDDNKLAVLDVKKAKERYVRCVVIRGGDTGAVVDGVIAIKYKGRVAPTTQPSSVAASEFHVSPDEGTA